jgi:carbonic anhydrase
MIKNSFSERTAHVVRWTLLWAVGAILAVTTPWAITSRAQEHGEGHSWGYDGQAGPSHWGDLEPQFAPCKNGHHQSPVDIRATQKTDLAAIRFDYKPVPLHIVDNGHTILITYAPGSSIRIGDKQYDLQQFHFHRPSEDEINGKRSEMELHLVHVAQDGSVAVVAVLLRKGEDNPLVDELWGDLPKTRGQEQILKNVQINAVDLLPADRRYYTFSGSLTTPPCTENVTWYVLKHPITVSPAEIEKFSRLYRHDARPTQPLNGRLVQESR